MNIEMTGFQQTGESLKDNQESKVREDSSKNEPIQIDQDFEIENSTKMKSYLAIKVVLIKLNSYQ